jgi:hypothetical protein
MGTAQRKIKTPDNRKAARNPKNRPDPLEKDQPQKFVKIRVSPPALCPSEPSVV